MIRKKAKLSLVKHLVCNKVEKDGQILCAHLDAFRWPSYILQFYGWLKLKSVNLYFINIAISSLNIRRRMWLVMMPDLINGTAYETEIFPSSLLQLNSSFTTDVQMNTAFQFKTVI